MAGTAGNHPQHSTLQMRATSFNTRTGGEFLLFQYKMFFSKIVNDLRVRLQSPIDKHLVDDILTL